MNYAQASVKSEPLPTYLGMFVQRLDKDKVAEIKKKDYTNALVGKDELLKDDDLPIAEGNPNLLLYSDSREISPNDLQLIQLDTIKSDGTMKYLEFQAAPVDEKPDIKRIRIPDGLANGKYAFVILDGDLDDGKHKFWAFQIKNSDKANNDATLKSKTVSLKPKEKVNDSTQTQTNTQVVQQPSVPPPVGSTPATLKSNNVIFRSGPTQNSAALGKLSRGQKVYVIGYSSQYEYFTSQKSGETMYSNYAEVQTQNGKRGWVYAAYLR